MAVFTQKGDIETIREAGRRLALVLEKVIEKVVPGVTEILLDEYAYKLITEGGDVPAFLNYTPAGASFPYPATLCISVNERVVHGIPRDHILKEGDIITVDIGLTHKGMIVDMAKTVPVGTVDSEARKLLKATEEALYAGIKAARADSHIGDIGYAVESTVKKYGFNVVRELGGHGVGKKLHEPPFIPNFGQKGKGQKLTLGMLLAIEPIVNEGSGDVVPLSDGYTLQTKDGKRSAQFEHTILITEDGAEIITKT